MVLASLKHHTEGLHRRVESALDLPRRLESRRNYEELLARLYGFYAPFEARLIDARALDGLDLNLADRLKSPLLVADLIHLGYGPGAIASLPRSEALPGPKTTAEVLGCLYVLEGSTLGGQFIRRQVERSLGLSGAGVAFFSSYGADVGRMWEAFCDVVESAVIGEEGLREAREFAARTFEAFEGWLKPVDPLVGPVRDWSGT